MRYQPETKISCRSFLSLYAYSHEDDILLWENVQDGYLLILYADARNNLCAYPPIGRYVPDTYARAVHKLEQIFAALGRPLRLCNVEKSEIDRLHALDEYRVLLSSTSDEDDYVYASSELTRFDGPENYNRRMNANRFRRKHDVQVVPLENKHYDDCMMIIQGWCDHHGCSSCGFRCPKRVAQRVLRDMPEIGATGALLMMDGKPEAAALLGDMGGDMMDLICIFTRSRQTGMTYCLLDAMCRICVPDARWINFEEDMGLENLRHFKRSLHPAKMIVKHEAYLLRI